MVDRTSTGIDGLDKALNGGLPFGNIVLVSGGAGTGKSTLCLQFLVNGAEKFKEKGLYISTEQNPDELSKQASCFGWNLKKLQDKGLLKVFYLDITAGYDFLKGVKKIVEDFKPKRIVIDSMTTLTDSLLVGGVTESEAFSLVQIAETVSPIPKTEKIITKTILYNLIKELKSMNATALLTSELYRDLRRFSADGVSEFLVDGIILLSQIELVGKRNIRIVKMRYSSFDERSYSYEFGNKGLVVSEPETGEGKGFF